MVADLLFTGKANAITAAALADILETDRRRITEAIQRERIAGQPIIGGRYGYYLARTPEEVHQEKKRLQKMIRQLLKVTAALEETAQKMTGGAENKPP